MARPSYLAIVLVAWLAAACRITSDFDGAQFACEKDCPDGQRCIDGECVDPTIDAAAGGDDAAIDAAICECVDETFADDCGAGLEDIASGAQICASTASNTNAVGGCTGAVQPGADAVFRLGAAAGETITATVVPEGFDAALYITRDCSQFTCEVIADDFGVSGTETASVTAQATGDYFIVVDTDGGGAGCYVLDVTVE